MPPRPAHLAAGLAVLAAACLAPAALAHDNPTSRMHNIRHVAQSVYGEVCDVGTMNVPIVRSRTLRGPLARFSHDGQLPHYTNCKIEFADRRFKTSELCRLIAGHEFGHAAGLPHSKDIGDIMYPVVPRAWAPCGPERPWAQTAASSAPPDGRPTVLLVPGGGWQNADPATMEPWRKDFEAHGIRARVVTYPLRDVPAAIEHVGKIADQEPGPVVAYGISAGGTIAAALAANGRVAGAVNVVGPTDFGRWITPSGIQIMAQIGMDTAAEKRAASPIWMLNGRQAPTLLQCGAVDPLVSIDQCTRYVDAARRGQPDTRLTVMAAAHNQPAADMRAARDWITARWPTQE